MISGMGANLGVKAKDDAVEIYRMMSRSSPSEEESRGGRRVTGSGHNTCRGLEGRESLHFGGTQSNVQ